MKSFFMVFFYTLAIFGNHHSAILYNKIADITNPTESEYLTIQDYIERGIIPHIEKWKNWNRTPRDRGLNFFLTSISEIKWKKESINTKKKDVNTNCIVLYASYNEDFPDCLEKLVQKIKTSDYVGDIIYRIGGWPNIEAGDFSLSHIPKAYKLSAIREAYRLGYEQVLWIECTASPDISLNTVFDRIKKNGVYGYQLPYKFINLFTSNDYLQAFNISMETAKEYMAIDPRVMGFDLTNPICIEVLDSWYTYTKENERSCFTQYGELTLLSFMFNQGFPNIAFLHSVDHINTNDTDKLEFSARGKGNRRKKNKRKHKK